MERCIEGPSCQAEAEHCEYMLTMGREMLEVCCPPMIDVVDPIWGEGQIQQWIFSFTMVNGSQYWAVTYIRSIAIHTSENQATMNSKDLSGLLVHGEFSTCP